MNDSNVHVGTHPTGHPNKTAVNAENPIFGRPADPIPEVSIQQSAVVQSEKSPRETVQSPLINEGIVHGHEMEAAGYPPAAEAEPALVETKEYTDGTTATGLAPLPDLSPAEQEDAADKEGVEEEEEAPQDSETAEAAPDPPLTAA